jgi:hypothetical protein
VGVLIGGVITGGANFIFAVRREPRPPAQISPVTATG